MQIHRLTADTESPCSHTDCGHAAVWATRGGKVCDMHVHPAHRRIANNAARLAAAPVEPSVADRAMIAIDFHAQAAHAGMPA